MPRTLQEIISHADELADRFENIDPSDGVEQPVAEYLLQRAVRALAASERQVVDAVRRAREDGVSWRQIGSLIGTSGQAAHERYGPAIDQGAAGSVA